MKNKIYEHISDCWKAIDKCKSLQELNILFKCFPRWSGDWDYEIDKEEKVIVVINDYYIEEINEEGHDEREYQFDQFEDINGYVEED